ncbi:MAG: aspartate/glutamate racemase family protein [Burkholderiaceae bacterium]
MSRYLLINPNTSQATTDMMVEIAARSLPSDCTVSGATVANGPPMIITEDELRDAAQEVVACWTARREQGFDGVIVSAFGDPGIGELRALAGVPVVGICEASMLEGARGGRRFGVATVTPELEAMIAAKVREFGLQHAYTGIRLTQGPPRELAADPDALEREMAAAVARCIDDGAQAVIIGGGPLGEVADRLTSRFDVPVIAPIPAAVRQLLALAGAKP